MRSGIDAKQVAQHLVAMLAEQGRRDRRGHGVPGQLERRGDQRHLPRAWVRNLDDHVARPRFRRRQRRADAAHLAAGNARAAQCAEPVGDGARGDRRLDQGEQGGAIAHPRLVGGEARVRGETRQAEQIAKPAKLAIIANRDDQGAVRRREELIGHDRLMAVAEARRIRAGDQSGAADIGEHGELAIIERHVDMLADAVAVARDQGGEHGLGGGHAGVEIGDRDAGPHRRAVRLAGRRHHPAFGLDHEVIARPLGQRRGAAIAGDRAINRARD